MVSFSSYYCTKFAISEYTSNLQRGKSSYWFLFSSAVIFFFFHFSEVVYTIKNIHIFRTPHWDFIILLSLLWSRHLIFLIHTMPRLLSLAFRDLRHTDPSPLLICLFLITSTNLNPLSRLIHSPSHQNIRGFASQCTYSCCSSEQSWLSFLLLLDLKNPESWPNLLLSFWFFFLYFFFHQCLCHVDCKLHMDHSHICVSNC